MKTNNDRSMTLQEIVTALGSASRLGATDPFFPMSVVLPEPLVEQIATSLLAEIRRQTEACRDKQPGEQTTVPPVMQTGVAYRVEWLAAETLRFFETDG